MGCVCYLCVLMWCVLLCVVSMACVLWLVMERYVCCRVVLRVGWFVVCCSVLHCDALLLFVMRCDVVRVCEVVCCVCVVV